MVGISRRKRTMARGKASISGMCSVLVMGALALALFFTGCTTELLDTIQQMVDFSNRTDKEPPQVIFTTPQFGAQSVPRDRIVTVTFSEPMDPETITGSTFTVEYGNNAQPGTVLYVEDHNMAMWIPSFDLFGGQVYTGRIRTGVRDVAGNKLQAEYSWNFQTGSAYDTTPPSLDFSFPGFSVQGVGINIDISAGFDEPLDPRSVNESTFTLWNGSEMISGTVRYSDASSMIVLIPNAELVPNTWYTVKVSSDVKDLAGNALGGSGAQWDFETGSTSDVDPPVIISTTPQNGDVNLQVSYPSNSVLVEFDDAMNPESINGETLILENDQGSVAGTVTYLPSLYTAKFTPNEELEYMTVYTASISGAVEDVAGNQLGTGSSWSFVTVANDSSTGSVTANIVKVTDTVGTYGTVSAYVLFTDQSGNAVTDLTKYHFQVREKVDPDPYASIPYSGIARNLSRESKSVVLVLDYTPSMGGGYFDMLRNAVINAVLLHLDPFDTAMLVTFAGPNPSVPIILMYPPNDFPPNGYLTSDRSELYAYLNAIPDPGSGSPGVFSFVHDSIGYGMEDMMDQTFDEMRALNAVIAFTDASPTYYVDSAWDNGSVLSYAAANGIEIYTIGEKYATEANLYPFAYMGYATSGYFRYASSPSEYWDIYSEVRTLMDEQLRSLYKITWYTSYTSGQPLDIEIQVDYSTETGGDFNSTDTEVNYPL
jgi:hypothetical protein